MKYYCQELTVERTLGHYLIRVWYNALTVSTPEHNFEYVLDLIDVNALYKQTEIAELVAHTEQNLNAVQVIDINTHVGKMLYTAPFSERDEDLE